MYDKIELSTGSYSGEDSGQTVTADKKGVHFDGTVEGGYVGASTFVCWEDWDAVVKMVDSYRENL